MGNIMSPSRTLRKPLVFLPRLRLGHITESIWLRAFGTLPKSCFAGLQIRSERYMTANHLIYKEV